jgi:uncharacterized membrane protein YeaQ/YmgE (transglycosylase-associated protein family)
MAKLPKSIIQKYGITKKAWSVFRGERRTKKVRGVSMARRTRSHRSRSRGGFGGGKLMNGLYKPQGIIGQAILGIGGAQVAALIPVSIPYKELIGAYVVGGLPGAATVYLMGNMSSSGGSIKLY